MDLKRKVTAFLEFRFFYLYLLSVFRVPPEKHSFTP